MGLEDINNIPVVDFGLVQGDWKQASQGPHFDKVVKEFGDAMSSIGFCYIRNHGVDLSKIQHNYKIAKDFFELPTEIKRKYRKPAPKKSFHGYSGPGDELLNEKVKNSTELREIFDVWGFEAFDEKMFPPEAPGLKASFDVLRPEFNNLARKLLVCYAKYLKLDDDEFFVKNHTGIEDSRVRTQTQLRTMYYYPLDPNDTSIPPNAIRCGEHADWGTVTLLTQDMTGGLEVKKASGEWIQATPVKDTILVNNAQLLEYWTGGRFPAALHRVRIMEEERLLKNPRQSMIYFVNPDGDTKVRPIVPLREGYEHFADRPTLIAYDHYQRLIEDAASY